ncbi:hypothetical protein POVCU2_0032040 [Plasmodium ovale curtisi]|uniref:Uncharacterized protein n=1 Tax=Plasmodium ovale curtisi TaxID=864141 RepID=A0A1A8W0R9_PLAOA|nr:hypothetical protein POVCU2_0032040 [Plasmodium ovale curtisi]SBS95333.1 hypothetical protein POVCU1_029440 [Plasmodium ovale curtisi]
MKNDSVENWGCASQKKGPHRHFHLHIHMQINEHRCLYVRKKNSYAQCKKALTNGGEKITKRQGRRKTSGIYPSNLKSTLQFKKKEKTKKKKKKIKKKCDKKGEKKRRKKEERRKKKKI